MKKPGNANENDAPHHLYQILDKERGEVFKYGICGKPLLPDGTSSRANRQVRDYNRLVGWFRFFADVLLSNISGRRAAKAFEDEQIEAFRTKNGQKPAGND